MEDAPTYAPIVSRSDLPPPDPDRTNWLREYHERVERNFRRGDRQPIPKEKSHVSLSDYKPWWSGHLSSRMRPHADPLKVDIDFLIVSAVEHSPQVLALRTDPLIRETAIVEEQAEFDWTAFIESKYDDNSDPVGNSLTVGGNGTRFRDHIWSQSAGVRRQTTTGGEIEVSQRIGYQDNNSSFFIPNQQGTAKLQVSFTQPLLNGSGRAYNQSRIVLARIDTDISRDELSARLQEHLIEVNRAYWEMYRARVVHLQKQKLLQNAVKINRILEARRDVDSVQRQILRTRAAVATRRSEIARAAAAVRDAQARLRLLVNDPSMIHAGVIEMIPTTQPKNSEIELPMQATIHTALMYRPDISQAIQSMRATGVRLGVAKKDLLPRLDLILGTYVSGLAGQSRLHNAYGNQFDRGEPGYSVGLIFEVPIGNRAAKARHDRRCLEVKKALHEFHATVEAAITDVELAVRESRTSYQEMEAKLQSMITTQTEANYLLNRWRMLPGENGSTVLLLEDLLDAQVRVAEEEFGFTNAQISYVLAMTEVKRATGTLLAFEQDYRQFDLTGETIIEE